MPALGGGLGRRILEVADRHEGRLAITAGHEALTYGQLLERAAAVAAILADLGAGEPGARVAVLCERTCDAYIGILAALLAGAGYVPLNPRFPLERNRRMLECSGATAIVIDATNARGLSALREGRKELLPAVAASRDAAAQAGGGPSLLAPGNRQPADRCPEREDRDLAYLLFTSGSTGVPKGVPISQGNVAAYLDTAAQLSGISPEDRLVQIVDLTFDLSVHDMFLTWTTGAALFSVPDRAAILATRLVEEHELTGWMSVPSTASMAMQSGLLRPDSLPSLRFTFFCGEALPTRVARSWAAAAPGSTIHNVYGPTEATVAFSGYQFAPDLDPSFGIVPIGLPFPGQHMGVFDPEGRPVAKGEGGELCLAGSQLTQGYWNAPDLDRSRFFTGGDGRRWYRTGDAGRFDPRVGFVYAGRLDQQVKIRGFRVELQEIENVVRAASDSSLVAVVPVAPHGEPSATGCVAFVVGDATRREAILLACRAALPDYMVPAAVLFVDDMPLNANGKIDRGRLQEHPALAALMR